MSSTFAGLTIARLAIQAAQKSLDVTGNNIANINTEGYTRQRVDQCSFYTGGGGFYTSNSENNVGSGALITQISQTRDQYLDIRYRREMAYVGSEDAQLDVLYQLQSILDEVGDTSDSGLKSSGIEAQILDLATQLQNFNTDDAGSSEFETLVRASAESLCQLFNITSQSLDTLQGNITSQYVEDVEYVNTLLKSIRELNVQISKGDINGEAGLELRDQRNQLIDELSEYMRIDVTYGLKDAGVGTQVETLTIGLVDPATNKVRNLLVDDDSCATISTISDNPAADGNYELSISELFDPYGVQTSDTSSKYHMGNITPTKTTDNINGETTSQTISINYKDADGNDHSLEVTFDVLSNKRVYKQDSDGNTIEDSNGDPMLDSIKSGRSVSIQNLADALSEMMEEYESVDQSVLDNMTDDQLADYYNLKEFFDNFNWVCSSPSGLTITSKGKGVDAYSVTNVTTAEGTEPAITFTEGYTDAEKSNLATLGYERELVADQRGEGGYVTLGRLQSLYDMLTAEGEYTDDPTLDKSVRGIPYYQKALDNLANKFATEMNNINTIKPDGTLFADEVSSDGTTNPKKAGALFDAEGGGQITAGNIKVTDSWRSSATNLVAAIEEDPPSESNTNAVRFVELLTTKSLSYTPTDIVRANNTVYQSGSLKQDTSVVPDGTRCLATIHYLDSKNVPQTFTLSFTAGASAGDTASNLLAALGTTDFAQLFSTTAIGNTGANGIIFDAKEPFSGLVTSVDFSIDGGKTTTSGLTLGSGKINGDVSSDTIFTGTFTEMFTNIDAILGNDYKVTASILNTYNTAAEDLSIERDNVSGVSLDEEGISLLQYQKAYAAACRLMTALDEVLDKLINDTGVVGR